MHVGSLTSLFFKSIGGRRSAAAQSFGTLAGRFFDTRLRVVFLLTALFPSVTRPDPLVFARRFFERFA